MRKKRKLWVGLVLLVFGGLFLKFFLGAISSPAVGVISYPKPASATVSTGLGFDMTPVTVSDNYSSFTYPKSMNVAATHELVTPVLANYEYSYHDSRSFYLSISVLAITGGNIASVNAYQFRKLHPESYKESTVTANNQSFDVMTDITTQDFSKVAFVVSNNYQATVSLTGSDTDANNKLDKIIAMVLGSWQWKGK